MAFAIKPPLPPMEVRLVEEIPAGEAWQYEPKRDSGEPRFRNSQILTPRSSSSLTCWPKIDNVI
jgi:hypothetical protein